MTQKTKRSFGEAEGGLLDGITVLDLSRVGPATRAARWLADYGASVVKIGRPGDPGPAPYAYRGGRGWRYLDLDLRDERGARVFLALVRDADVVLESFRPGVLARLGLGYDVLSEANPGIVLCSTTGYGQDGPRREWAGHDLNYLAAGGYLGARVPGSPAVPPATIADAAAGGMQAVIAIQAALLARARTGRGAWLDVAVVAGVAQLMALRLEAHAAAEDGSGDTGLLDLTTGAFACYATYPTADGGEVAVGVIEDRFWRNLCRALGLDRWADHQLDRASQEDIRRDLAEVFRTRTRDAWVELLAAADTCVAPVLTLDEIGDPAGSGLAGHELTGPLPPPERVAAEDLLADGVRG
ncbi:MAG: CoA transferase [Nocardioidaceae bacterium]|nr:CoA transferase [Nocardioidaceae bacterium]